MALTVYASNRIELLAAKLSAVLEAHPPLDPMAPSLVCVGSKGMERWLRHRIAMGPSGIAMNLRFPFPQQVLGDLFAGTAAPVGDARWAPDALAWQILGALPAHLGDADFAPLDRWLRRPRPGAVEWKGPDAADLVTRDRWALARATADVLDRASLFRPDWIAAWEHGDDPPGPPSWQRKLWSSLRAALPSPSLPLRVRSVKPPGGDPVHVFALSSVPPLYLEAWSRVAAGRAVFLYMVAPSREYWADDASRARLRRLDAASPGVDVEALRAEQNPLLTALGAVARTALDAVQNLELADPPEEESDALFVAPSTGCARTHMAAGCCALHTLQDDLFAYRSLADLGALRPSRVLEASDDSVQFHDCHGATRQVEALREELLGLFSRHEHLAPRDVVVMTPDIATYAPLVQAVFSGRDDGLPALPTSIADLGLRLRNPVADVLLRVLELGAGRLTLTGLLDFAALDPVRRRFAFDDDDLEALRTRLAEAGARWGADAAERARHGNPGSDAFTLAQALDRLALGVVLPDDGAIDFAGVAPYDEMEGGAAESFGRVAEFAARLGHWRAQLGADDACAARSVQSWCDVLAEAARDLAQPADDAAFLLGEVLEGLAGLASEATGFEGPVHAEALAAVLAGRFERRQSGDRAISGAVTVCALQPMRSVPFRVLCLLGMDDGKFPRAPTARDFDRTLAVPRPGDHDPREEDRNLLLECVLSAREHLLIFWAGRDACTNEGLAPAVPVGDLLDVCDATFAPANDDERGTPLRARDVLTRRHAVQPFARSGFAEPTAPTLRPRPRRFDARMFAAADRLAGPRSPWPGIHAEIPPLPPETPPAAASIDDFVGWLRKPVRTFLQRRLGVSLALRDDALADRESLELDGLESWGLGDTLLEAWLAGERDRDVVGDRLAKRAQLPPGTPGRRALVETWRRVETAVRAVADHGSLTRAALEAQAGPVRLRGFAHLAGDVVLSLGLDAPTKPRRVLRLCVDVLCRAVQTGGRVRGLAVGGDGAALWLASPDDPVASLASLADLWRKARARPLRLFEKTSHAYAEVVLGRKKGGSEVHRAVDAAARAWSDTFAGGGAEGDQAELAAVFPLAPPFAPEKDGDEVHPEFDATARALWSTVFACQGEDDAS